MKKLLLIAIAIPVLFTACAKDKSPKKDDPVIGQEQSQNAGWFDRIFGQAQNAITVTDFDGEALTGAQVLIGDALDNPFSGNFLTTDANGIVALPARWTTELSVTASAPGYVRSTYLRQAPGTLKIMLHRSSSKKYQVSGVVSGLPVKDFDKIADFALVMPALTRADLMAFDLNTVISPLDDSFQTLGQSLDVPSNISLPKQKERFSILTATLDKPVYRSFLSQPGVTRMFALRGSFPFSEVAGDLRNGKSFFDVLNKLNISGGGIRDINVQGDSTKLDLPGNELAFTEKRKAFASSIRADETYLAVGVAQKSGYMIPTDVKNLASGEGADLNLLPKSNALYLGVIKKTADLAKNAPSGSDRMSAALVDFTANVKPAMLPMIADPKLSGSLDLILPAINPVNGVQALMTYTVLSQIYETNDSKTKVKNLNRLWEVYAPAWVKEVNVPTWPNDKAISGAKRWEVSYIGGKSTTQPGIGPAIIEAATHVTHSSIDF